MDQRLAADLSQRLDDLGLRFAESTALADLRENKTVPLTLTHSQGQESYRVGYSRSLTSSSLEWTTSRDVQPERVLLLGPRVTERSAEIFRSLGINFIDSAGNAFIAFRGVHIDIRGRRPERHTRPNGPRTRRGGVNLFSPKRSQVIFAILACSGLLERPVRDVAASAGVSLGQAQETLDLLIQYGFLAADKRLLPIDRAQLMSQWASAYPTGLGSLANAAQFSGDFDRIAVEKERVYVSGESAVSDLLRPETIVVYTDESPTKLIRRNRWRRDDEHPTILVRHKFWTFREEEDQPGVYNAPRLLVYADLLAANEGRQREAASQIWEQLQ